MNLTSEPPILRIVLESDKMHCFDQDKFMQILLKSGLMQFFDFAIALISEALKPQAEMEAAPHRDE